MQSEDHGLSLAEWPSSPYWDWISLRSEKRKKKVDLNKLFWLYRKGGQEELFVIVDDQMKKMLVSYFKSSKSEQIWVVKSQE